MTKEPTKIVVVKMMSLDTKGKFQSEMIMAVAPLVFFDRGSSTIRETKLFFSFNAPNLEVFIRSKGIRYLR